MSKSVWKRVGTPKKQWPELCEVCAELPAVIEINRTVMGKHYHRIVCLPHSEDRIALLLDLIYEERMRKPWIPV